MKYLGKEHPPREKAVQRPCGRSVRLEAVIPLPLTPAESVQGWLSSGPEGTRVRLLGSVYGAEVTLH